MADKESCSQSMPGMITNMFEKISNIFLRTV